MVEVGGLEDGLGLRGYGVEGGDGKEGGFKSWSVVSGMGRPGSGGARRATKRTNNCIKRWV